MSDWWSKKLAPQQPQPYQPVGGVRLAPAPVAPVQQPQPQQQYQPAPAPQQEYVQGQTTLSEAIAWAKPAGPAHKLEGHLSCPNCGTTSGYTAFSGSPGMPPKPHCMLCGYSGSNYIPGDASNWGVA